MQHKTAFCLDWAAQKHGGSAQIDAAQGKIDLVKQAVEIDVRWLVDHQAQRASLAVLAHIDNAAGERFVLHTRHGNQKMIRQVHAGRIGSHPVNFTVNMSAQFKRGLVWFRRDLRTHDNPALHHALQECDEVYCVFVFDKDILDTLPREDRRVRFIHDCVLELAAALAQLGSAGDRGLIVQHARAASSIPELSGSLKVQAVYAGQDDEPSALKRDAAVRTALAHERRELRLYKDHTIFARSEVMTQAGTPYTVFTPYKKAWLAKVDESTFGTHRASTGAGALAPLGQHHRSVPSLEAMGFAASDEWRMPVQSGMSGGQVLWKDFLDRIDDYEAARNFPGVKGPSYLGVHLRFGTVSIRELAREAHRRAQSGSEGAATWLSELIWRDFYAQLMSHYPHVVESSFRPAYDAIAWEDGAPSDRLFEAWCSGQTGYPLVDAAMAQINQTGYMHNRLRMVVASFLIKDLGIDWRRGEAWFAEKLNDFELASNNGGWQWASSSGCDAQPWFRIFNPVTQSQKFDPNGGFIRRYLPQLKGLADKDLHAPWLVPASRLKEAGVALGRDYPQPLVDHAKAREKTLARYAVIKEAANDK